MKKSTLASISLFVLGFGWLPYIFLMMFAEHSSPTIRGILVFGGLLCCIVGVFSMIAFISNEQFNTIDELKAAQKEAREEKYKFDVCRRAARELAIKKLGITQEAFEDERKRIEEEDLK